MPFAEEPAQTPSRPEARMHRILPPKAGFLALDVATPTTTRLALRDIAEAQISDGASPFNRWYELQVTGNAAQVKVGDDTVAVTLNTDGSPMAVGATPVKFWLGKSHEHGFVAGGKVLEPFIAAHGIGAGFLSIRILTP
jgi:hypothetical protein